MLSRLLAAGARTLTTLADLVLPADCAGCHAPPLRAGPCCATCIEELAQPPIPARPTPVPPGLPACVTGGVYGGVRRELILAYKERGRRGLSAPLGDALAGVVRAGWPIRGPSPLVLVPVPGTAAAIRTRHGDHMLRLARRAAVTLRRDGLAAAVARPLRALPKADSAHLGREARAAAARHAFALRAGWTRGSDGVAWAAQAADAGAVVLLDDVLTTGATLAAVAGQLLGVGVPVTFAATLAASRLRSANGHPDHRSGSNLGGDGTVPTV